MDLQEQKGKKKEAAEDDLLNFDLEDISLDDIEKLDAAVEEDVIDLTDLIEKGSSVEEATGEENLLDEVSVQSEEDIALMTAELTRGDGATGTKPERQAEDEPGDEDLSLDLDFVEGKQDLVLQEKLGEDEIVEADLEEMLMEEEGILEVGAKEAAPPDEKEAFDVISEEDLKTFGKEKGLEGELDLSAEGLAETEELLVELSKQAKADEPLTETALEEDVPPVEAVEGGEAAFQPLEVETAPSEMPPETPAEFPDARLRDLVTEVLGEKIESVLADALSPLMEKVGALETVLGAAIQESVASSLTENMATVADRLNALEAAVGSTIQECVETSVRENMAAVSDRVSSFEEAMGKTIQEYVETSVRENMAAVAEKFSTLEADLTRIVQDGVERFSRETMTAVAERIISEAIEALKKSLMDPPGE